MCSTGLPHHAGGGKKSKTYAVENTTKYNLKIITGQADEIFHHHNLDYFMTYVL